MQQCMRRRISPAGTIVFLFLAFLLTAPQLAAQKFQTFQDCAVGKRVSTNDGRKGTITRLDKDWSYCYVRFDDDGKEQSLLYSLLNAEGSSAASSSSAATLRPGTYECVSSGGSSLMNLRITGSNAYSSPDGGGTFRIEQKGRIIFETGPMKTFHSMLLSGGRIGLNNDGGTFYAVTCEFRGK